MDTCMCPIDVPAFQRVYYARDGLIGILLRLPIGMASHDEAVELLNTATLTSDANEKVP